MKKVSIIGGGASGTLLAVNLLRSSVQKPYKINLIEKRERVGVGVAYSTAMDTHLLNVPASKMGAYADKIEHFHEWLVESGYDFEAAAFVPRKFYGNYLSSVLEKAINERPSNIQFELIDDEAVDVSITEAPTIILGSGRKVPSDQIVLAFGNFPPPNPSVPDQTFTSSPKYFQNPWSRELYDAISPDDTVFIVGTGLSMVDVVLHLRSSNHRGTIGAISTRGLLPAVHKLGSTYPSFHDEIKAMDRITDIAKAVRRHIEKADSEGSDWRAVIDSLRPATQKLWMELPLEEKKYFKQHLSRYWNAARHRMPKEAADVIESMKLEGRLQIMKGRLRSIEMSQGTFEIRFGEQGVEREFRSKILVNCIGSETNFERIASTLVENLLRRGFIKPDALYMGLDALPDGTVIGRNGVPPNVFYTLGTALKGILWESTAIPEIRAQAKHLAERLTAD